MPLVRDFSENDKIFRGEKNTLNNERYRDLLISILSYGSFIFLAVGEGAKLKFVDS